MALSASVRRAQYLFHHRSEASRLLMYFLNDFLRPLHRNARLNPCHVRLPSRVFVSCAVQNLTHRVHKATVILREQKSKLIPALFFAGLCL